GGSIHVYGTLRGRAMAGSNGNTRARIFCSKIEAELLAIDGHYLTADLMDKALRDRPVQAWLEGSALKISALDSRITPRRYIAMAKVVVVTSGKGGVGKTTSTAALGAALAQFGQNVVVVDFDVGLRHLALVMGGGTRGVDLLPHRH